VDTCTPVPNAPLVMGYAYTPLVELTHRNLPLGAMATAYAVPFTVVELPEMTFSDPELIE
jgi:hypothetical protein